MPDRFDAAVSPTRLAQYLDGARSPQVIAVHEAPARYDRGHVPGARLLDPTSDLAAGSALGVAGADVLARRCAARGLRLGAPLVFYDDGDGRQAARALWTFAQAGYTGALQLLDGGLAAWARSGHTLAAGPPAAGTAPEKPAAFGDAAALRALRAEVATHVAAGSVTVDARSPAEYAGVLTNRPDAPQEGILRGGHLPGARNIPHTRALRADGSFLEASALRVRYLREPELDPEAPVIVYSRDGARACHTWFVLACLLGFARAKVYDGSWMEWGNLVGAAIVR